MTRSYYQWQWALSFASCPIRPWSLKLLHRSHFEYLNTQKVLAGLGARKALHICENLYNRGYRTQNLKVRGPDCFAHRLLSTVKLCQWKTATEKCSFGSSNCLAELSMCTNAPTYVSSLFWVKKTKNKNKNTIQRKSFLRSKIQFCWLWNLMAYLLLFLSRYWASNTGVKPASVSPTNHNPSKILTHRQQRKKVPKIISCSEGMNKTDWFMPADDR